MILVNSPVNTIRSAERYVGVLVQRVRDHQVCTGRRKLDVFEVRDIILVRQALRVVARHENRHILPLLLGDILDAVDLDLQAWVLALHRINLLLGRLERWQCDKQLVALERFVRGLLAEFDQGHRG